MSSTLLSLKRASTLVLALVCLLHVNTASAQAAPAARSGKPVVLVVPYGAGGSTDIMARIMAQHLPGVSGQSAIVENRTGGAVWSVGIRWPARHPTATRF